MSVFTRLSNGNLNANKLSNSVLTGAACATNDKVITLNIKCADAKMFYVQFVYDTSARPWKCAVYNSSWTQIWEIR